jgi:hypothetical protein
MGFTLGVMAKTQKKKKKKKSSQSAPKLLIKCGTLWLCIGAKALKKKRKRILTNLGSQFATLETNVRAFINIQMSMF